MLPHSHGYRAKGGLSRVPYVREAPPALLGGRAVGMWKWDALRGEVWGVGGRQVMNGCEGS